MRTRISNVLLWRLLALSMTLLPQHVQAAEPAGEVVGLDHYALHVTNLQRSADWYERISGFRILHRWNTTWMIDRGNVMADLFLRPRAQPVTDPNQRLVIEHIAFLVDGDKFDTFTANLRVLGVAVEGSEDTGIAYSAFFSEPDGHTLEITTYHPPIQDP